MLSKFPRTLVAVAAATAVTSIALAFTGPSTTVGTIGTQFGISGNDFGTKKKPKVTLVPQLPVAKGPKTLKLKVHEHSEFSLDVEIKKATAGMYTLMVQPKGGEPQDMGDFEISAPAPADVSTATADPLESVTVTGEHFGTKKGKVVIGGLGKKPAGSSKVKEWTNTSVTFLVSKKLVNGTYDIHLLGKAGTGTLANSLTVENSTVGLKPIDGKELLQAKFGDDSFKANVKVSLTAPYAPGNKLLTLNGIQQNIGPGGGTVKTFFVSINVDLDTETFPKSFPAIGGIYSSNKFNGPIPPANPKSWALGANTMVTIDRYVGGRITGSLSGSTETGTNGGAGTLAISRSKFVLDVE